MDSGHPLPLLRIVGASAAARSIVRSKLATMQSPLSNQYALDSMREFNGELGIVVYPMGRLMKSLEMQ